MRLVFDVPDSRDIIALALAEDLGVDASWFLDAPPGLPEVLSRDVTTWSLVGPETRFEGRIVARKPGVVCGMPVVGAVYESLCTAAGLPDAVDVFPLLPEGSSVARGTAVAEVSGPMVAVLAGERTALDLLMILSGIATEARRWQEAAGEDLAVCDTRKTWPGLRALSKYAVRVGGATNHRMGLFDMVLVKDNHRALAGGVATAVRRATAEHPELLVEIEAETLADAVSAVDAGADLVLLDNMDDRTLIDVVAACRRAADACGRIVLLEASGGIAFERLPALRASGIDRVSASAITLAPPLDFGLDEA
jgi:nicotinate-nucleotide pyrophosphorylase (carboxylating)